MVLTRPAFCGTGHPGAMLQTLLGNVDVQLEVLHVQLGHSPGTGFWFPNIYIYIGRGASI